MKALEFERNEGRYAAAAIASRVLPGSGAKVGPLRLVDIDPPELPGEGWVYVLPRLSGICGSDLSTVEGRSSPYFEPYVSFPFVPGHEVVGELEDGTRVILEPVLGHSARGFEPPFPGAAPGDGDDYRHLVSGSLEPGIQVGFCASTGGGWSTRFAAHESLLRPVPDSMDDEMAVVIEPAAGGVHAALRAGVQPSSTVVVYGAGTMGLVTIAALRHLTSPGTLVAVAKYPRQKELAADFGADLVVEPAEAARAIRRVTGSFLIGDDQLSGGADAVVDAVGNARSIAAAIGLARPRGRVIMLGMPGVVRIDLTALWHRETELVGAYTYGTEVLADGRQAKAFDVAIEVAQQFGLDRIVSAHYPLDRYAEALAHAAEAGRRGGVKVVFDMRDEKRR
ncbi:MAG: zinc-binding alcohol dehydrogenase [Actinobacteria bacterium]|nr:MAG: zinc-binding alcohol dehydrogenase [Actinomycetota bacterium]RIK08178.1 MAG: zinc-binding alcohol dehydrogenase [Acidobacteriota bacterium]